MVAEPKEWLVIGNPRVLQELVPLFLESDVPSFTVMELHNGTLRPAGSLGPEIECRTAEKIPAAKAGFLRLDAENGEAQNEEDILAPYSFILYACAGGDLASYRQLRDCCKRIGKALVPALFLPEYGILGPVTTGENEAEACLESALLRLASLWGDAAMNVASKVDKQAHQTDMASLSPALMSVLSNAAAHYAALYLKNLNGNPANSTDSVILAEPVNQNKLGNQIYLFDEENMVGKLHAIFKHPLAGAEPPVPEWSRLEDTPFCEDCGGLEDEQLYSLLDRITSPVTGLLHELGEGAYKQLPLSVCAAASPGLFTEGPAGKLSSVVYARFDHLEARREAGLAGLEAYLAGLGEAFPSIMGEDGYIGIGVGAAPPEAVGRAFRHLLQQKLKNKYRHTRPALVPLLFRRLEDQRCQYYLQALERVTSELELYGCEGEHPLMPVLWVRADGHWYYASDLKPVYALRRVLAEALLHWQTGCPIGCEGDAGFLTPEAAWNLPIKALELEIDEAPSVYRLEDLFATGILIQANEEEGERESQPGKQQWQLESVEIRLEPALKELAVYGLRFNGGDR